MEPKYKPAITATCDVCEAGPNSPCLNHDGTVRDRMHGSRSRMPALYVCRHCGGPYSISSMSGARVHVGKVDATHSAEPHDRIRPWSKAAADAYYDHGVS